MEHNDYGLCNGYLQNMDKLILNMKNDGIVQMEMCISKIKLIIFKIPLLLLKIDSILLKVRE